MTSQNGKHDNSKNVLLIYLKLHLLSTRPHWTKPIDFEVTQCIRGQVRSQKVKFTKLAINSLPHHILPFWLFLGNPYPLCNYPKCWNWKLTVTMVTRFLVFFLQVSLYAKHTQLWYLIICMITKILWIFTHLLWYILTWADSLNQICISTEPLAKLMTLKLRYNGIIIFVAPILIS